MAEKIIDINGTTIPYIEDKINIKEDINNTVNNYVGANSGSNVEYIGNNGKVISFTSVVPPKEIVSNDLLNDYINKANTWKKKPYYLICPLQTEINGNYQLTGFDYYFNDKKTAYVSWEFTQVLSVNFKTETFKVFTTKTNKKSTKTIKQIGTWIIYLLWKCGTLKRKDSAKASKCVKYLQKFMQKKGFYTKYKLDGKFQYYTQKELKRFQKKYKLKDTGVWDSTTIKYWRKRFKKAYPTALKKYKV